MTLFQYQLDTFIFLVASCSFALLLLSQFKIIYFFMALRFRRDLDLKYTKVNSLSYSISKQHFNPMGVYFFHFWNNFFCWLPWHHNVGWVLDDIFFCILSFSHISSLYMALNPNRVQVITFLLNISSQMSNRHLRWHDWSWLPT